VEGRTESAQNALNWTPHVREPSTPANVSTRQSKLNVNSKFEGKRLNFDSV